MHTIKDAKQLECRQASHYNAGTDIWTFPRCSGDKCAHWRHDSAIETKYFNRSDVQKAGDYGPDGVMSDEEWNAYIDARLAEGWTTFSPHSLTKARNKETEVWHYNYQIRMTRELPHDKWTGSCGLIMPDTLDINT